MGSKADKALEMLLKLLEVREGHERDALREYASEAAKFSSLAEAERTTARIQALLTRYKLDLTDVERARDEASNPMTTETIYPSMYDAKLKPRRLSWSEDLIGVVAYAFYCTSLATDESNTLWLVGQKRDVQIATGVFLRLARTALVLMNRERERVKKEAQRNILVSYSGDTLFKESFLYGFVNRLSKRLYEKRQELEAQALIEAGECQALVRAQDAVVKYAQEITGGKEIGSLPTPEIDAIALRAGMIHGATTSLEGGDLETTSPDVTKQLETGE